MAKIKNYSTEPPFCVPYHPVIFKDIEVYTALTMVHIGTRT
jgi:hypothetical protein